MSRAEAAITMMSKARPYSAQSIPRELKSENIGELITIQMFDRDSDETIIVETLSKYVGRLKAYSFSPTDIRVKLEGLDVIVSFRHRTHIEIIL
jgi:hypothetical protein